jgi:acetylornithine deacetylase/succinyl-diaminopimelate desuccinylase-like protein
MIEVLRLPGRTPLILIDIPGGLGRDVLLYGHLDKQPEMTGWLPGLGPWQPVLREDRLYGRGGADDGYSIFAIIAALLALRRQGVEHPHCVAVIEASEESSSADLPAYLSAFSDRLGHPSLIVCLDSGCGNYEQLWLTTSLRGMLSGILEVEILDEGVHSGDASGVVPSSFRILRSVLARLEDMETGFLMPAGLNVSIPPGRRAEAALAAGVLGKVLHERFPFVNGAGPVTDDAVELILNRTWRPQLEITGVEGIPPFADAGTVLRPRSAVKISLRLPPSLSVDEAATEVERCLIENPPYGASVRFTRLEGENGWDAPPLAPWLAAALDRASIATFGSEVVLMGEGGSIPFMGMLGRRFPQAQFVITGVLGPHANAHGPNEFLHIPTAKRVSACIAMILAEDP